MAWRFSSPLIDSFDQRKRAEQMELARSMADAAKTRGGRAVLLEAALFLIAAAAEVWFVLDAYKTGSWQSGLTAGLLFLLTFWPFMRHRLQTGIWP